MINYWFRASAQNVWSPNSLRDPESKQRLVFSRRAFRPSTSRESADRGSRSGAPGLALTEQVERDSLRASSDSLSDLPLHQFLDLFLLLLFRDVA